MASVDEEEVQLIGEALAKAGWTAPFGFWKHPDKIKLPAHKETNENTRKVLQALVDAKVQDQTVAATLEDLDETQAGNLFQHALKNVGSNYSVSLEHQTKHVHMLGMEHHQVVTGPSIMHLKMEMTREQLTSFINLIRKATSWFA